jgi:hypothetical protein
MTKKKKREFIVLLFRTLEFGTWNFSRTIGFVVPLGQRNLSSVTMEFGA